MMKPKIALVKDGFLPAGAENKRGRLSGAAIDRCKELAAKGWKIEGYESKASKSGETPTVEKVKVSTTSTIADIGEPFHHEEAWQAFAGDVEVGMRTVCNTCHSSLTYCPCPGPVVNIDFDHTAVVDFRARKSPLPNKRW